MNHQRIASYLQKNRFLFLALVTVLIVLFPVSGKAEEANLNFYVTPEFPDSQVEGSNSYFDLNLEPGATESLTLTLQNASDEPIQVRITPHTAYTNVHGVVEYGKDAEEADPTLLYALDELIESPKVIDLAGNETKMVDVALHMPQASFDGFLAGGLRISEVKEESEEEPTDEEGLAIKNEFAYVIGVIVSNSRNSVKPDLELLDVFADQLNHRNVISATIQNFTPTFVNRMAVEATVQRVGEDGILYEASEEMMQMAPNSHFHFPISLGGDRFVAGDYLLKLKATSGEEEWSWERAFTIETDEARSFNRADVTIDTSTNWWMIGAISLLVLLAAVLLYLIIKRRKQATKQEK
ncbi:DUF916 and DUF3324 domain-containing protein [Enterococcus sp. DIV0213h]|uniref:DUF916 and DUF3324 domain-containing protein n=1 Tax=Enterococcus sp. DIV0213h TaxID=2774669 RepID=UPI003F278C34